MATRMLPLPPKTLFQGSNEPEPRQGKTVDTRSPTIIRVPRKVLFSEQVSFRTAELRRKTPRVILGGHETGGPKQRAPEGTRGRGADLLPPD